MEKIDLIINVISLSIVLGCTGCFDQIERTYWSDKSYEVADDAVENCKTLYHGGEIARITCITRLGYNQDYIIASSLEKDKGEEQFWILNKKKDDPYKNSDEVVEGPFTFEQFNSEKKKLGIENVKFRKRWSKINDH